MAAFMPLLWPLRALHQMMQSSDFSMSRFLMFLMTCDALL